MIGSVARLLDRLSERVGFDLRHYGGFVFAGGTAFLVDIGVLQALTATTPLGPLAARPFSILCGMLVSWYLNRTITFAATEPATFAELLKFATVVWVSQVVNYAIYAVLLLVFPALLPSVAVGLACIASMFVSYAGYRYGVFRPAKETQ